METKCHRVAGEVCRFCEAEPDEACVLDDEPFAGPPIGASMVVGTCSDGEVCEACQ